MWLSSIFDPLCGDLVAVEPLPATESSGYRQSSNCRSAHNGFPARRLKSPVARACSTALLASLNRYVRTDPGKVVLSEHACFMCVE